MNHIQMKYMIKKGAYDAAFALKDWELVDKLEDQYLDAESDLVEWTLQEVEKTGKMSKEDIAFVRKNMSVKQIEKLAEMGMRLAV